VRSIGSSSSSDLSHSLPFLR
jgi:hypothetical protein